MISSSQNWAISTNTVRIALTILICYIGQAVVILVVNWCIKKAVIILSVDYRMILVCRLHITLRLTSFIILDCSKSIHMTFVFRLMIILMIIHLTLIVEHWRVMILSNLSLTGNCFHILVTASLFLPSWWASLLLLNVLLINMSWSGFWIWARNVSLNNRRRHGVILLLFV